MEWLLGCPNCIEPPPRATSARSSELGIDPHFRRHVAHPVESHSPKNSSRLSLILVDKSGWIIIWINVVLHAILILHIISTFPRLELHERFWICSSDFRVRSLYAVKDFILQGQICGE